MDLCHLLETVVCPGLHHQTTSTNTRVNLINFSLNESTFMDEGPSPRKKNQILIENKMKWKEYMADGQGGPQFLRILDLN